MVTVVVQDNGSCSPTHMAVTYQVCDHIALNTKKGNFHKSGLVRLNHAGCSGYVIGYALKQVSEQLGGLTMGYTFQFQYKF